MKSRFCLLRMTSWMLPLLFSAIPLTGCGKVYWAEAITAHVVDRESGKPLEGVIVVAHWELYGGFHPDTVGQLNILETVTDQDGKFQFPAWGPKQVPSDMPSNSRLVDGDPVLVLYKPGYKPDRLSNKLTTAKLRGEGPLVRTSDWNGKKIELERFGGDASMHVDQIARLGGVLGFAYREPGCDWKKIPRMIAAIEVQAKEARQKGLDNAVFIRTLEGSGVIQRCGSSEQLLREYMK